MLNGGLNITKTKVLWKKRFQHWVIEALDVSLEFNIHDLYFGVYWENRGHKLPQFVMWDVFIAIPSIVLHLRQWNWLW